MGFYQIFFAFPIPVSNVGVYEKISRPRDNITQNIPYIHSPFFLLFMVFSTQGSKEIRQWSINCCTSPMIIDCNWWFNRLDTKLNEGTNENSIKVPKSY